MNNIGHVCVVVSRLNAGEFLISKQTLNTNSVKRLSDFLGQNPILHEQLCTRHCCKNIFRLPLSFAINYQQVLPLTFSGLLTLKVC